MEFTRKNISLKDADGRAIEMSFLRSPETPADEKKILLFIHGFIPFGSNFTPTAEKLTDKYDCIIPDLKGYGESDKQDRTFISYFDQAHIIEQFITLLELDKITLVIHSTALLCILPILQASRIKDKLHGLIMISPCGFFTKIPPFISKLAMYSDRNPLIRFAGSETMAYLLLSDLFYDKEKIDRATLASFASGISSDDDKESLIAAAKQISPIDIYGAANIISSLEIPCLAIRGRNDAITSDSDVDILEKALASKGACVVIDECGHIPHLEKLDETAEFIMNFPTNVPSFSVTKKSIEIVVDDQLPTSGAPHRKRRRFTHRMLKLFDRRTPGTFIVLVFIKFLQLLKTFGLKASENGWRKATGIFMRNEYSKFMLAAFRLKYPTAKEPPSTLRDAKQLLARRLRDFLHEKPAIHWSVQPGFYSLKRRKCVFTDIVEAKFFPDGTLEKIIPRFESFEKDFPALTKEDVRFLLDRFVKYHNFYVDLPDSKRAVKLYKSLKRMILRSKVLSFNVRIEMNVLLGRLLNASYINFEILPEQNDPDFLKQRLATPDIRIYRHPGFGLLNIVVRLSNDFSESDLWFQFHHVPVDGQPMQELMQDLKNHWGVAGPLRLPAVGTSADRPEIFYSGSKFFRARMFIDFSTILAVRKYINKHYRNRMRGSATIVSLILWSFAQSKAFRERKMLFPLDLERGVEYEQERELSLVFIRPCDFFDEDDELGGFLRFQHEFNHRVAKTRVGRSESYELLSLYGMIHPIFYHMAQRFMPRVLSDVVGTMGVTMLRDAEIFIAPMSDLQTNGFCAFGNMTLEREDGTKAGAVSICATREQIRHYMMALRNMNNWYEKHIMPIIREESKHEKK